ncbi:ABC transporter permease [Nocardioides jiangxiensis]|uniref:ABC transporter permease n=1 Tax=Nocardioides jiangxiensis TaxID=3064524 RepID=A0ABT9AZQ5_9ACTN|nr:ABC transporter permease [Nocardioides sp. WY-20]MDO7867509.1 ABC transporter permease [Nocardioides sp. WY-20]
MTGWLVLLRMALRRDRVLIPAWIAVFAAVAGGSAAATDSLYSDPLALASAGHAVNSAPALLAMYGPVYDVTSLGAVGLVKMNAMGAALVGLLGLLLVARHTRADEEVGRTELAAAGAVGRHAALAAALATSVITVVGVGLVSAVALAAAGLDAGGSFALGAAWVGCGVVFAAVGAVAAQLTTAARASRGIAVGLLVSAYVVRAVADASGPSWLTWLSPVGWSQQVRAYAGDRWWPLAISLAAAVVVAAGAVRLESRRDLGAGLLADRPGPAGGGPRGTLGLAWRLHRTALLGWTVGLAVLGVLLGSIAGSVSGFVETDAAAEMIRKLGGTARLVDAFLAAELDFTGLMAAAFALSITARLAGEEAQGRTEEILATPTGRLRWVLGHLAVAGAGAALLVLVVGAGAGLSRSLATGEVSQLPLLVGAAAVRIPAVWTMAALGLLLYAVAARAAVLGWAALVGVVVLGEFGPLLRLPVWMQDLSPYRHVPALPGGDLEVVPLVALCAVAVGLVALGGVLFGRRDVTTG